MFNNVWAEEKQIKKVNKDCNKKNVEEKKN